MSEPLTVETQKICSKCGKLKNLDDFSIDKRNIGGHVGICKSCKNLYYKEKYRENPKKYIERGRIWKEKHPKKRKKYSKEYRETHKEYIKELHRNHYRLNRRRLIAKSKAYYEGHKDEVKLKKKIYRDSHKEETSQYNRRYRGRKKLERRGII